MKSMQFQQKDSYFKRMHFSLKFLELPKMNAFINEIKIEFVKNRRFENFVILCGLA